MCTLYTSCEEHGRRVEEIRQSQGDQAADEYHNGMVGAGFGGAGGMCAGAVIGTFLFPGVGTVIGGLVGYVLGANDGSKAKTSGDVALSAGKAAYGVYKVSQGQ